MDDAEIIAAVAEGTAKGLTAPFPELLLKLFGRAADELGMTLQEEFVFFAFRDGNV